jgi:DivIVA domain-containing protein
MDVTPKHITEKEFSLERRGYDQDEVDDFLEQIGETLSRLMNENAELRRRLETRPAEAPAVVATPRPVEAAAPPAEESLSEATRTLRLAQRTADAAVAEAKEEAAKLLQVAQTRHDELVQSARANAEAEYSELRATHERELVELQGRIRELAATADAMNLHVDHQREGIDRAVHALRQLLDDPTMLVSLERPEVDLGSGPTVVPLAAEPPAPSEAPPASAESAVASPFYETGATDVVTLPTDASSSSWGPGSWSEVESTLDGPEEPTQAIGRLELEDDDEYEIDEFFQAPSSGSGRSLRHR